MILYYDWFCLKCTPALSLSIVESRQKKALRYCNCICMHRRWLTWSQPPTPPTNGLVCLIYIMTSWPYSYRVSSSCIHNHFTSHPGWYEVSIFLYLFFVASQQSSTNVVFLALALDFGQIIHVLLWQHILQLVDVSFHLHEMSIICLKNHTTTLYFGWDMNQLVTLYLYNTDVTIY